MLVSVTQFSHNAADKTFSVDGSDLNMKNYVPQQLEVLNPKTGNSVTFTYFATERNSEGEDSAWWFHIEHADVRKNSKLSGYTLVVYND